MSTPLQIAFAAEAGLARLREGFNRGFADYPYGARFATDGEMARFLERSGMALADCAVLLARERGAWRGVGVALLAVDGEEAWCGGLAVAPPYRGQGWGSRLMATIEARAVARGARRLRLEVLVGNEPARRMYRRLGYTEWRELLIWERPARQGALPVPYEKLQPADPAEVIRRYHRWHDLPPVWQRRAPYLLRNASLMEARVTLARDGLPVAYVLYRRYPVAEERRTVVNILDMAVDPAASLLDAGRPILQALQLTHRDADLLLINEPADSKLSRILVALNFLVTDRQHELVKELNGSHSQDDRGGRGPWNTRR